MKDYRAVGKLGEGTFSEVVKMQSLRDGNYYACKQMKQHFESLEQVNSLREVQALRRLNPHPNILTLHEVVFDRKSGCLALICELMDMNIYELIRGRRHPLPEKRILHYMYQLCRALDHMHRNGIFHRDVKPENILIKQDVLKLGDFGSCRSIYSKQPYTEYISTRWYRAPECLLTDGFYTYKMDVWSAGCVFYEIASLRPLFPGTNELDQISKIHDVIGTPAQETLTKFQQFTTELNVRRVLWPRPPRTAPGPQHGQLWHMDTSQTVTFRAGVRNTSADSQSVPTMPLPPARHGGLRPRHTDRCPPGPAAPLLPGAEGSREAGSGWPQKSCLPRARWGPRTTQSRLADSQGGQEAEGGPEARGLPVPESRPRLRHGAAPAAAPGSDQTVLALQPRAALGVCPGGEREGAAAETPAAPRARQAEGRPQGREASPEALAPARHRQERWRVLSSRAAASQCQARAPRRGGGWARLRYTPEPWDCTLLSGMLPWKTTFPWPHCHTGRGREGIL